VSEPDSVSEDEFAKDINDEVPDTRRVIAKTSTNLNCLNDLKPSAVKEYLNQFGSKSDNEPKQAEGGKKVLISKDKITLT